MTHDARFAIGAGWELRRDQGGRDRPPWVYESAQDDELRRQREEIDQLKRQQQDRGEDSGRY